MELILNILPGSGELAANEIWCIVLYIPKNLGRLIIYYIIILPEYNVNAFTIN